MTEKLEEVLTFPCTGTRGAATFISKDVMWRYMTDNKGNHQHEFEGRRIYIKTDAQLADSNENLKEKDVRKVVRALIERDGRAGDIVKANIDARCTWGAVWWKGEGGK